MNSGALSNMENLLSTDPLQPYTEECAALAIALPGTLTTDRCVSTLWYRTRTLLLLAASYPRLMARVRTHDRLTVDMLKTTGTWNDFGKICETAMTLLDTAWSVDIPTQASSTYMHQCFPKRAKVIMDWLNVQRRLMERTVELCNVFYGKRCYNETETAVQEIASLNFVPVITKTRLLKVIVRGMMATENVALFDRLKCTFSKIIARCDNITPRLKSCANVTLRLCGFLPQYPKLKLMASLLREVCVDGGVSPNELYDRNPNLLILRPDLLSNNVFFAPDITMVFNLKRRCLGIAIKPYSSVPSTVLTAHINMLAYAVMESARMTLCADLPSGVLSDTAPSACRPEYVKVDGVPSDDDDEMSDYIDVRTLTPKKAEAHGFAMWHEGYNRIVRFKWHE